MTSWTIEYEVRPWSLNKERTLHHMARAKLVKEWREAFRDAAIAENIPPLEMIEVIAQPYVLNARYRQDTGNCFPALKAAVDGLIDAGVIIDDNSTVVVKITFLAPIYGRDALSVTIIPIA
jgi:hypothetical protein